MARRRLFRKELCDILPPRRENQKIELLRGIRAELAPLRGVPEQMSGLRSEFNSLRADDALDFVTLNAENEATRAQIVGLRRALIE
jgi:hypothetical protein